MQVPHDSLPLSQLFERMNSRPDSAGIVQWALRQTSMEEVFLSVARQSEVDMAAKEEDKAAEKAKEKACCNGKIRQRV